MELEEFFVIQRKKDGLYHSNGSSWCDSVRKASQYKTKKIALANCWRFNSNDYRDVKLLKMKVEKISEEEINPNEFAGFSESRCY